MRSKADELEIARGCESCTLVIDLVLLVVTGTVAGAIEDAAAAGGVYGGGMVGAGTPGSGDREAPKGSSGKGTLGIS